MGMSIANMVLCPKCGVLIIWHGRLERMPPCRCGKFDATALNGVDTTHAIESHPPSPGSTSQPSRPS